MEAADTLLGGGLTVERDLASAANQIYFLPNEIIVREMDLCPYVFIVHRGKIMVRQNGNDVMLLSKV